MDILKIQTLIAQGKLVEISDLDPTTSYVQLGVYEQGNRQIGPGNANSYPPYVITLQDILNSGGGGLTCLTLPNCQEIIDINADIASINAILPTKFNTPTGTTSQYVRGDGSLAAFPTIPAQYNPTAGTGISITGAYPNQTITNTAPSLGGTVTSVGLSMPPAFNVANSPVTGSDTIAVTAAGLSSQYVRGDGILSNFPEFGGGGASASYYLNGGTSQGSFGGNTYYQINRLAVAGVPATFTRTNVSGNGYIAYFITDAGDPAQLSLPGGNWDFKLFMNADSAGGTPSFYVELYKYDGVNFTLIADNSTNPKAITSGATVDLYTVTLAVSTTTLTLTDRLAVRIYVNVGGKDITLNTQDGTLCQILTTFTTGLTALNGLTPQIQTFAVGQSGTDFNINSAGSSHTFNLPVATATESGKLSNFDWIVFSNKLDDTSWVDYSALSTITGWASYTTKELRYRVVGKQVFVHYSINGTSNSAQTQFSLPFVNDAFAIEHANRAVSGGTSRYGFGVLGASTSIVIFYFWTGASTFSGTWAATNNKFIRGQFFYTIP